MSIIKLIKDNYDLKETTDIFNLSFSDYVYPLQITEIALDQKISGDNVSMDYSIGVFNQDTMKLEGFLLHAPNDNLKPTQIYNSATGIIPSARGKTIQRCYQQLIPYYIDLGIKSIVLEVISNNLRAIKAYENCGFKQTRVFDSYKGEIDKSKLSSYLITSSHTIFEQVIELTQEVLNFIDNAPDTFENPLLRPSWSNTSLAIKREFNIGVNKCWIARNNVNNEIIGFISLNSETFRIRQLYVSPKSRNQNIATNLMYIMSSTFPPSTTFNFGVDNKFKNVISFFSSRIGFQYLLSANEMLLIL